MVPLTAQAGEGLEQVERYLEEMEYRKALSLADRLLSAGGRGPEQLVQIYRIRGLCLAGLDKPEASMQAFRHLLAVDPEFRLSTAISPRLAGGFYQAVAYSKNQKPITLVHRPPETGAGEPLERISVSLQADPLGMVKVVRLVFSPGGGADQTVEQPVEGLGEIALRMQGLPDESDQVTYYLEALDAQGSILKRVGSLDDRLRWTKKREETTPVVARQKLDPPQVEQPAPVAPAPEEDESPAWYETAWFWATVGVVVAGAVTGTAVALTTDDGSRGPVDYAIEIR